MRILCFSDVHAQPSALKALAEKAKQADLLICAGDISMFGDGLEKALRALHQIGKPVLIVHGNHESEEEVQATIKNLPSLINVHKRMVKIHTYTFFGYCGGGFSFHEPGMERFAQSLAQKIPSGGKRIFITHAPPYNTALDYLPWLKEHRGCKTTVEMVKRFKPDLAVCGHFHETAQKSCRINKTFFLNPGPLGKIVVI